MHSQPLQPRRAGVLAQARVLALVSSALLAACGGGNDTSPPAVSEVAAVPPGAVANVTAFSGFVGGLTSSEVSDPLDLAGVEPPTSDTDEPVDVS